MKKITFFLLLSFLARAEAPYTEVDCSQGTPRPVDGAQVVDTDRLRQRVLDQFEIEALATEDWYDKTDSAVIEKVRRFEETHASQFAWIRDAFPVISDIESRARSITAFAFHPASAAELSTYQSTYSFFFKEVVLRYLNRRMGNLGKIVQQPVGITNNTYCLSFVVNESKVREFLIARGRPLQVCRGLLPMKKFPVIFCFTHKQWTLRALLRVGDEVTSVEAP